MENVSGAVQPQPPSLTSVARGPFLTFFLEERVFLALMASLLIAIGWVLPYVGIARWLGFALAGYSAVANDSVQTLGTFLGSNRDQKWWILWLFIGGIFLVTVGISWLNYGGDVTSGRLAAKDFNETPMAFTYLQIAAPIILLFLTRLGIPVSTTFLLLSCFAPPSGIGKVLVKSLLGYGVAFGAAIVVWLLVSRFFDRWQARKEATVHWRVGQWLTTGMLWSVWLMQDASNIAVYLPRALSVGEFAAFASVIFMGLGVLFKVGGERVQQVVQNKSRVVDVRAATLVDLIYAAILYVFKIQSNIPMSTTWVFVGLLAGREIAMTLRGVGDGDMHQALKLAGRDLAYVSIGLVVSLALALAANDEFRASLF